MATTSLENPALGSSSQLTPTQGVGVLLQVAVLSGAAGWKYFTDLDTFQLLWSDPLGVKMTIGASLFTVANFVLLIVGCHLLNYYSETRWQDRPNVRNFSMGALWSISVVCLYLPALFVLLIGPTAIAIQRNLLL